MRYLAFALLLLGSSSVCAQSGSVPPNAAKLMWDAPTTDIQGDPLPLCKDVAEDVKTCLNGHKVYVGPASRQYDETFDLPDETVTTYSYDGSAHAGTERFFAVTAYNREGGESEKSDEVSKVLDDFEVSYVNLTTVIDLYGDVPAEETVIVELPNLPAGDVTVVLQVFDPDQENEGELSVGSWSTTLFAEQRCCDNGETEMRYTVPVAVFDAFQDCEVPLKFTHTATAGYRVLEGQLNYPTGDPCKALPPPTIREAPVMLVPQ